MTKNQKIKSQITRAVFDELNLELEHRTTVLRAEIAVKLGEAKALGDLSENALYTDAVFQQDVNESRINEIQEILESVTVADIKGDDDIVGIGEEVLLKYEDGTSMVVRVVGPSKAKMGDFTVGSISSDSPIGSEILGKKYGAKGTVTLPNGTKKSFTIARS